MKISSICTGLLLATHLAWSAEGAWKALFNGRDLSGWSVQCVPKDAGKGYWFVSDGAIVVDSMEDPDHDYVWLQSDEEYADFELQLKFQLFENCPGNSGVQIRSRYDAEAGWLDGPQLDIHPSNPVRAGLIYDETRGSKRWICPSLEPGNHAIPKEQTNPDIRLVYGEEHWNTMQIVARGTRITCVINGETASEYDGSGVLDDASHRKYNVGLSGHIALQLHRNSRLRVRFKDIRVRELP